MAIFFVIVGIFLTAITLPLIVELLAVTSSFLIAPKAKLLINPQPQTLSPCLAVIVPAHNEESTIQDCVTSLLASANGLAEVLVVAHNCSDATAKRASAAGAKLLVYNNPATNGKGHALRHGFDHAIGTGADAVLVVDADSVVSTNLIPQVLQTLSQGGAAVQCRYEMLSADTGARGQLASLAFRAFTYVRSAGRERMGFSAGISGNGFALTARLLNKVPYDAFSVVEDLEYHIHTVMAGERVRFIEDAVVTSYFPVSTGGETTQQSRWQGGRFGVAKKWIAPMVGSIAKGKFRLIEPALDLAGLPMAFGVAALLAACLVPVPWVRLYAVISLGIIACHVLAAAWAGPNFLRTLGLLIMAPFYILWKLRLLPKLLKASSSKAEWVKTDRGTNISNRLSGDNA